jgi:ABC-type phosphate transport system substrate-binding protein
MRITRLLFALVAVGAYLTADAQRADVKIIVNPNVNASEISRDDLNRIFLLSKTSLPGASHLEPVLEKAGRAHDLFLKLYMDKSDAALTTYYLSLLFSGKSAIPKSFDSDSAVAEYVAKTKGAIGYVGSTTNTPGVKTLKVK